MRLMRLSSSRGERAPAIASTMDGVLPFGASSGAKAELVFQEVLDELGVSLK